MAAIKVYTDIEQSKKLAEILPLESADMFHFIHEIDTVGFGYKKDAAEFYSKTEFEYLPCWSLAALLNIIPTIIGSVFEKDALRLRIDKSETDFNIWYENLDTDMVEEGFDIIETNPIDACYEMILKLNELNLL